MRALYGYQIPGQSALRCFELDPQTGGLRPDWGMLLLLAPGLSAARGGGRHVCVSVLRQNPYAPIRVVKTLEVAHRRLIVKMLPARVPTRTHAAPHALALADCSCLRPR